MLHFSNASCVQAGAVAPCRATQQALLTAPWPTELIGHHRSCIRTSTKTIDSAERAVHLAASDVLFRGLRVRMGIGTGLIEKMQVCDCVQETGTNDAVEQLYD